VLFELGWFYGRFGPKRLSIIRKTGTQLPTDLAGIAYIEFTSNVKEAFMSIRDELRRAGAVDG
jgi:predicted nucleotide-binding protein